MAEVKDRTTPEEDRYVKENDPVTVGKQATKRKTSELLAQNQASRSNLIGDYNQGYKDLKKSSFRNFRSAVEGASGLSGGQTAGRQGALSALEMEAMGNYMSGRSGDLANLDYQKSLIGGLASEYGQQQREIASANQQTELAKYGQIQSIINAKDKDMPRDQKIAQLKILGMSDKEILEALGEESVGIVEKTKNWWQEIFNKANANAKAPAVNSFTQTPYGTIQQGMDDYWN